ncbi:MAG: phosphate ABC transporter substrate-binding protein PstS [Thermoplasmata archaeon]|nr:phosphate ABC transporter substrate-binding protein PstS [Thermoplasmata archaeon]
MIQRKANRTWILAVVVVVILCGVVAGVGYQQKWFSPAASQTGACPTGITLEGNGAQFVQPLVDQWVSSFDSKTSNQVDYTAGGSGTGITDLQQKAVDFAVTDDPLTPSQQAGMPGTVLTLPVAGGALAVVYDVAGVTTPLRLSGAVLANIYLGKVTHWNDPSIANNNTGVTLPDATILTVHRSDAAGTTFVLTDFLSQDSPAWAAGPGTGILVSFPSAPEQVAIKGDSALLTEVTTTANTIGYTSLSGVLAATTPASYAAILNPSGTYVLPNATNTASAIADKATATTFPNSTGNWSSVSMVNAGGIGDYPLATFAYMYVVQNGNLGFTPSLDKTEVVSQWLTWIFADGQSAAAPLNYVPLPTSLVAVDQKGVQSMSFNGAAIPSCS